METGAFLGLIFFSFLIIFRSENNERKKQNIMEGVEELKCNIKNFGVGLVYFESIMDDVILSV